MDTLKNIGVAITGSFCCFERTLKTLSSLLESGYLLKPVLSYSVQEMSTRFFNKDEFRKQVENICGEKAITSIVEAEPIGPKKMFDALIVLPCTGNTLAKLAQGITDTPVTMAVKAHIRNERPVLICVSTNDGLSTSFKNIATLMNKKNVYISPFSQDDPIKKPNSLVVDFSLVKKALEYALEGKQIQPILV